MEAPESQGLLVLCELREKTVFLLGLFNEKGSVNVHVNTDRSGETG